jgi:hypothetical protein
MAWHWQGDAANVRLAESNEKNHLSCHRRSNHDPVSTAYISLLVGPTEWGWVERSSVKALVIY